MSIAQPDISSTQAYQDKLMGLLGERDPIEVLAKTPSVFAAIVSGHTAKMLHTRPFPGKWTPCEIIGHLCDAEWVYGYRVRLILCENEPTILSMSQDHWVEGQRYNERDPRELVQQFANMREINLHLWRGMAPTDLTKCGVHNERGRESLGLMLKMNAGHDLSHIDQITRYIAALK